MTNLLGKWGKTINFPTLWTLECDLNREVTFANRFLFMSNTLWFDIWNLCWSVNQTKPLRSKGRIKKLLFLPFSPTLSLSLFFFLTEEGSGMCICREGKEMDFLPFKKLLIHLKFYRRKSYLHTGQICSVYLPRQFLHHNNSFWRNKCPLSHYSSAQFTWIFPELRFRKTAVTLTCFSFPSCASCDLFIMAPCLHKPKHY